MTCRGSQYRKISYKSDAKIVRLCNVLSFSCAPKVCTVILSVLDSFQVWDHNWDCAQLRTNYASVLPWWSMIGNISVVISDVGGIDIYILGDIKTHLYQYHYNLDQKMVDDPMLTPWPWLRFKASNTHLIIQACLTICKPENANKKS